MRLRLPAPFPVPCVVWGMGRMTTAATTRRRRTVTQGRSPPRRTADSVHPAARWTPSRSRLVLQPRGQHATLHGPLQHPMTRPEAPAVRPLARRLPPPPPHPETLSRLR